MGTYGPRHHRPPLGELGLGRADPTTNTDAPGPAGESLARNGRPNVLDAEVHVGRGRSLGHARVYGPPGGRVEDGGEKAAVHDSAPVAVLGSGISLHHALDR